MAKVPSPCIGVCEFKRDGHCIGCSMTKDQKKIGKGLKGKQRAAFVDLVMAQQAVMGHFAHWRPAYLAKCRKRGVAMPDGPPARSTSARNGSDAG